MSLIHVGFEQLVKGLDTGILDIVVRGSATQVSGVEVAGVLDKPDHLGLVQLGGCKCDQFTLILLKIRIQLSVSVCVCGCVCVCRTMLYISNNSDKHFIVPYV